MKEPIFLTWKDKLKIIAKIFIIGGLSYIGGLIVLLILFNTPRFVKDEVMIANFKNNRAIFDELVRRYQNQTKWDWYKFNNTPDLFRKIGVDRVHGAGYFWPPNPYDTETAKGRTAWVERKIKEFHGCSDYSACYKYDGVGFDPIQEEEPSLKLFPFYWRYFYYILTRSFYGYYSFNYATGRMSGDFKEYLYVPQIPRIENGRLMTPLQTTALVFPDDEYHFEKDGIWFWQKGLRLFPSLDKFPDDIERGECVYRQIEPQWFISLCKGS